MRVLIVGAGAREHALAWKLGQSPLVESIATAPGNGGTALLGDNWPLGVSDAAGLIERARRERIDLVVPGTEEALAAGLVDACREVGILAAGPTRAAAEIETSKAFAKDLMQRHGLPCARSETFGDFGRARRYILEQTPPIVVKADGLAAGKGVTVATTHEAALAAASEALVAGRFGLAGQRVVIEEYLAGREVSLLALTDGTTVVPLVPACDYKRVFDDDTGPNTGGMGAYSPPGFFGDEQVRLCLETILQPAVRALAESGRPYRGVLYAGLMLTAGGPKLLEFNARLGDPETQVILPRLGSDLAALLLAVAEGRLVEEPVLWTGEATVGVVLAAGGYPGSYPTGLPITGLDRLDPDVAVFHAGTRRLKSGVFETSGGRVLTVVGRGDDLAGARERAYANAERIQFAGRHYRRDIAKREIGSLES